MTRIKRWRRVVFDAELDSSGSCLAGNLGSNSEPKIDARGNTTRGDYVAVSNRTSPIGGIMESNLLSTILTLRAFLPGMIEQRRGAVVTMSSSAARQPGSSSAAYAVAKAGVITLTRHLALELGPAGVRLNCVAPSAILTPGAPALA
jgi:NAD(P)-dependent dehydrogenase (short-subunit alcohol dehydrogenase family)